MRQPRFDALVTYWYLGGSSRSLIPPSPPRDPCGGRDHPMLIRARVRSGSPCSRRSRRARTSPVPPTHPERRSPRRSPILRRPLPPSRGVLAVGSGELMAETGGVAGPMASIPKSYHVRRGPDLSLCAAVAPHQAAAEPGLASLRHEARDDRVDGPLVRQSGGFPCDSSSANRQPAFTAGTAARRAHGTSQPWNALDQTDAVASLIDDRQDIGVASPGSPERGCSFAWVIRIKRPARPPRRLRDHVLTETLPNSGSL